MSLIHNHQLRATTGKVTSPSVTLDVVQAHNRVWVNCKNVIGYRQASLKPSGTCGSDGYCFDMKPIIELLDPLLNQVWWAKNSKSSNFTSIEKLSSERREADCVPIDAAKTASFEADKLSQLVGK